MESKMKELHTIQRENKLNVNEWNLARNFMLLPWVFRVRLLQAFNLLTPENEGKEHVDILPECFRKLTDEGRLGEFEKQVTTPARNGQEDRAPGQSVERTAMEFDGQANPSVWVSVRDRLPDRPGLYLCHCNKWGDDVIQILQWWIASEEWHRTFMIDGQAEPLDMTRYVTHWMELPEEPEGSNFETSQNLKT